MLEQNSQVNDNSKTGTNLTAIDLFCGCGGISCGLRSAGFRILAGVDIESKYIQTFTRNFPETRSLQADLSSLSPQELMTTLNIKSGEITLLAGGPPCQGFSKNVPRKYRYMDDPNNRLIRVFLDYCQVLKPCLILMENVAEMKEGFNQAYTTEVMSRLKDEGYTAIHGVVNAADYGVPQRRHRAFFIASRDGTHLAFPVATHTQLSNKNGQLSFCEPHVTVWEAIGDLPSVKHGEGVDPCQYAMPPFSAFQELIRNGQAVVSNHIARRLKPTQYQRISTLEPGQGMKDLPEHLQTKGGYSGAYSRLTKDMVAPTITRWVFHPGSGRWGHPVDARLLTIREVARIQSFPDSFVFYGSYVEQSGQLGNAVPPLLAQKIAEGMLTQLRASRRSSNCISDSKGNFSP